MAITPSSDSGDDGLSLQSSINVTPLVDVMLVLLVIFMVTAPMMQQGVEVNLPKATNSAIPGSDEQLVISIDKQGVIFLGAGNKIPQAEIAKKVAAILAKKTPDQQKVYIKGDTQVDYGSIMKVMGELQRNGISNIGLISAPPDR